MKTKKVFFSIAVMICLLVVTLTNGAYTLAANISNSGENEAVTYVITETPKADNTEAFITVMLTPKKDVTIKSILLPNGKEENYEGRPVNYDAKKNEELSFVIKYTIISEKDTQQTEHITEQDVTITYTVTSIQEKQESSLQQTDTMNPVSKKITTDEDKNSENNHDSDIETIADSTTVIDFNGNAKNQFVVITPDGYAIGPHFMEAEGSSYWKAFRGKYIITGYRKHTRHTDNIDVLYVKGGTTDNAVDVTLKDLTIDLTTLGDLNQIADGLSAIGIGSPNQYNYDKDSKNQVSKAVVKLTLEGDNVIKGGPAAAAIGLGGDASLTIEGDGKLTAIGGDSIRGQNGWAGSAIGSDMRGDANDYTGTVTINSGHIVAYAGNQDGADGKPNPALYSSHMGVAIGGGAGTVNINGGYVEAYGGSNAAGIGTTQYQYNKGDNYSKVNIKNATVVAKGGYGAPGIGSSGNDNDQNGYTNHVDISIENANVRATGGIYAAGIGTGNNDKSIADSIVIRNSVIEASAPSGAAIGNGILSSSKNIVIENCDLNLTGGQWSAAIGGGWHSNAGNLSIKNSKIQARGGNYGSGIGSGLGGKSDSINIANSSIVAIGGAAGAGIGDGYEAIKTPVLSVDAKSDVSAYAMGYGKIQDSAGNDIDLSVSAIEVDEVNSTIATAVLQGRFKTSIADSGDKVFSLIHKEGITLMTMPKEYNSFGRILPQQDDVKLEVDHIRQAGSIVEYQEAVLSNTFVMNQPFNYYWMIQPVSQVSVTFETNGGTPVPEKQVINLGDVATVPNEPIKEGFQFAGWYQDKELTQKYDFATPVTSDITLYSKWTPLEVNKPEEPDVDNPNDTKPEKPNSPEENKPGISNPDHSTGTTDKDEQPKADSSINSPDNKGNAFGEHYKDTSDGTSSKDKADKNIVETGDTTNTVLYSVIFISFGLLLSWFYRRRKSHE